VQILVCLIESKQPGETELVCSRASLRALVGVSQGQTAVQILAEPQPIRCGYSSCEFYAENSRFVEQSREEYEVRSLQDHEQVLIILEIFGS
jgi:hypothetical protein